MKKILVIGASGFVGKHVSRALLAAGYPTRCLARDPAKVADLAASGCEVVRGDMLDLGSMEWALDSVEAAYVLVHTLSPQPASIDGRGFMDVELEGLRNIVAASKGKGTDRLVYLTFVGASPDSPSAWVRGRWEAEQLLLKSGLDVTVLRPFQIAGVGGHGFDMMVSQARRRVTPVMGSGRQRCRNIAVDDLVYYLLGVLDDPRTFGRCYDVGCDDIQTGDQMIDLAAEVLGRSHPYKVHVPGAILGALAPLIERMAKLPPGAIKGMVDSMGSDAIGDPMPIRAILPRPPVSYRQAVEKALAWDNIKA